MVSLTDYLMGRDKQFPLTPQQQANAKETVRRVNLLLARFGETRKITSGYRPPAINAATAGAAKRSKHLDCLAADIEDANGKLDAWCMKNLKVLEEIGLWLEHPSATKNPARFGEGWCHVQIVPPKSGNRVFYP